MPEVRLRNQVAIFDLAFVAISTEEIAGITNPLQHFDPFL
jgi:hypothetical protein